MKKLLLIVLVIIIMASAFSSKEELRIRVIANSDSQYDQNVKYGVVNILKEIIKANDTRDVIEEKLPIIKRSIYNYLNPKNIDFSVEIKNIEYPPKEIGKTLIPAGTYNSLVVTIGAGCGTNWWSLLYPEYFDITFEDIESGNVSFGFYFYDLFK